MKFLLWLLGTVAVILGSVYAVLFTPFGNGLLKPIIESKIQAQTKLDSKLEKFSLGVNSMDIVLALNKNNTISLKGNYSLLSQSLDANYDVALRELNSLKTLTKTALFGSFMTHGSIQGDKKELFVKGVSDVAKSNTNYSVTLKEFNPTSIIAKIKSLDLKTLLYMLHQKEYATALVDMDLNFKNITPHHLDGNVILLTKDGQLNRSVMKHDFKLTIPKTLFAMKLNAKLHGDDIDYKYHLNSNLAKIGSSGKLVPQPLNIDARYAVNVKELAVLKPITKADLRGPLALNGTIKGSKEKMLLRGSSNIADSKTTFHANLHNFVPKSLQANIDNLKLQKLLYMLKQPHYADGVVNMNIAIKNANIKELNGVVTSEITKGVIDTRYMTRAYKFQSSMPATHFSVKTYTTLNKNSADTKVNLNSTLANVEIKNAHFDLKKAALVSDYKATIPNLNSLYFVTQRHMKGSFVATGEVKKAKDLDLSMHSDIAGGKLDAQLHNSKLHADINSLQTLKILDMLIYPKILKSTINGQLDYNTLLSKGKFVAKVTNGSFTHNQVLDLTKQYAHIDLYKQRFKGDVNADINKENILASLNLKSNTSSIVTKNTRLNSKTKQIHSLIDINANGNPLAVELNGNVASPKIKINANKIIQKEVNKFIQKDGKKVLNKLLKGLF